MQSTDNITLNKLLSSVAARNAGALHLTIGSPPIINMQGMFDFLDKEDVVTASFLERLLDILLDDAQRETMQREKDLVFTRTFNKILRFKVHVFFQKGSYAVTFQYIPQRNQVLADLGLPEILGQFLKSPHGFILVAGPYDSGRATTVAAMINTMNATMHRYIATLEAPIEQIFYNNKSIIEQREVGVDTPSFVHGMKFLVNESVDTLVLSSFDTKDIVESALHIVETGRLLIATVNASNVMNTITRVHAMFSIEEQAWVRAMFANQVLAIISQRLLSKIGGGRVLAYEFFVNVPRIRSMFLEGQFDQIKNFLATSREFGIMSLDRSLALLVRSGLVHLEAALAEAEDPRGLKQLLAT